MRGTTCIRLDDSWMKVLLAMWYLYARRSSNATATAAAKAVRGVPESTIFIAPIVTGVTMVFIVANSG